jgi:hypothetical protein
MLEWLTETLTPTLSLRERGLGSLSLRERARERAKDLHFPFNKIL